MLMGE